MQPAGLAATMMRMDEAVVMRSDLHVIEFAQCGQFSTFGEAAHHRAVELQNLDRLFLQQRAAAVAGEFALARGKRNARLLREQLELATIVRPAHRLLQPARTQAVPADARLRSRSARSQPRLTSTIRSLSSPMTSRTSASRSMSSFSGTPPALRLEPGVALGFQHLHLVAQFGHGLAVAIVGAGHIARHLVRDSRRTVDTAEVRRPCR